MRLLVGQLVSSRFGTGFPWGTFAINVLGSFLIGALAGWWTVRDVREGWRLFAITGCLGGFTTFSAFALESYTLLREDRFVAAFGYMAGSLAMTVGGCAAGFWVLVRALR
ncbi:MAG: CrcB family protein [Armatimonadetes bacterium]|nr:CrcB family protein [Armatimonadota bacterium]